MADSNITSLVPVAFAPNGTSAYGILTYIDNTVAGADGNFVYTNANANNVGIDYSFTFPSDLVKLLTLTYNVRYKLVGNTNDTETFKVKLVGSDGTAYSNEITQETATTSVAVKNSGNVTLTLNAAGLAASRTNLNAGYLRTTYTHSANMGTDSSVWHIDEIEISGTYEPTATVTPSTPTNHATGQSVTPQLIFTGVDPNPSDTLEYQVQVDPVNSFNSIPVSVGFNLKYIDINLYKEANPTDNVSITVLSGSITGSELGTSNTVAGTTILVAFTNIQRFTFATPIALDANTKYYFIVKRSGAYDITNFYWIKGSSGNPHTGGGFYLKTSTWGSESSTTDFYFILYDENTIPKITQNAAVDTSYAWGQTNYITEAGQSFTYINLVPVLDKVSDVETPTHFLDNPDEGDTHPFTNNTAVAYTVQTALSANTTYYWRVRAKDSGSGTWGAWSSIYSFTTQAAGWTTKSLKAYLGGSWQAKPLKYYTGGTWVTKSLKKF